MNDATVTIRTAETVMEILSCWPVMQQLRPAFTGESFLAQVQKQMQEDYHLVSLSSDNKVRAVAGFRTMEMLFEGPCLYVDDFVTDEAFRSRGFGKQLLQWLLEEARKRNCKRFDLDSGVQRNRAHRFYLLNRMHISDFRFSLRLS